MTIICFWYNLLPNGSAPSENLMKETWELNITKTICLIAQNNIIWYMKPPAISDKMGINMANLVAFYSYGKFTCILFLHYLLLNGDKNKSFHPWVLYFLGY